MKDQDLDNLIREAMSEEDGKQFDSLAGEPSLVSLAFKTLQGRNRWIGIYAITCSFIFMFTAIYCGWSFYSAPIDETKTLLGWSLGLVLSIFGVAMLKLWSWMEIEKYATVREIKRLELQVALMAQALKAK